MAQADTYDLKVLGHLEYVERVDEDAGQVRCFEVAKFDVA